MKNCTNNHVVFLPRSKYKCNGNCFQRNIFIYPQKQCQGLSYLCRPCSYFRQTCNCSFGYSFHQLPCFTNRKIKQGYLDSSSYRVTPRRITPSHVAIAAEAYRARQKQDFNKIDIESFDQNIPSVPSRKSVPKNNGIQVSSTSFITITTDDQISLISENPSEKNFEYQNMHTINRNKDKITRDNINNILNKIQIPKQTASMYNNKVKERSPFRKQPTIDKIFNSSELPRHNLSNELHTNTPKSITDRFSIDSSHRPTLPSTFPPNLNSIKSSEILIKPSRSIKSIPSVINIEEKSSIDITKSNLSLRPTRSTVDFGFLIDETTT